MADLADRTSFEWYQAACELSGIKVGREQYQRLVRGWTSWGRHYHTVSHLQACLREFDQLRHLALRPGEVELALWFHDAVYTAWRSDNEARSAVLAARVMREGGAEPAAIKRVQAYIFATRHADELLEGDAALVVDVDLSILGQPSDTYAEFERNVRREYWWVPRRRYVAGRCGILESFLRRDQIYLCTELRERYEASARANLSAAIASLRV
jgi:predicted metal-dependent HD superfamily phosphohydrolase